MQVEAFLERSARRRPEGIALVCGDRRFAYARLERSCNRLAHALIARGVRRGDRVAVCLPNCAEAVIAVFAALKAGAVFMMVNHTTKTGKLQYLLNHSRAKVLVTGPRSLAALEGVWPSLPHLQGIIVTSPRNFTVPAPGKSCQSFDDLLQRHAQDSQPPEKRAIDVDLASLSYTSGSTGVPKGVMLTHHNTVSAVTSIAAYLENTPDDVIFNVLPLSFGYGLDQFFMAFKVGATVILEPSFAYPHAVVEKLAREKATGFPLVPTISAILLQMDLGNYDFSRLRYITSAGAALPTEHIVQLRGLMPHVRIYSMYGLTECKRVSYLPPGQIDRRPTSVGKGMPNEEVYIVDDHGRHLGPGVVGELVVRGAHVMKGYWRLPEQTDVALKPGPLPGEKVLWTGDLFRMDDEGYLYFVSRKDDVIISRGEKVSPREVENVLYSHPGIAEAAVLGVPDKILGQAVKAVITQKLGCCLSERDVLRHCASHLEDFMVPQCVEFRQTLPKTNAGKIDKRELSGVTQ